MSARAFRLRVYPRNEREFGVALDQTSLMNTRNATSEQVREVVRAWGPPLRAVTDQLLETLRRSGYRPSELGPDRREPFALEEPAGVRLGLLLMAVKPLRKHQRIEEVAAGLRSMSDEEAYYWYSKCTQRSAGRRAQRALRVLLAKD